MASTCASSAQAALPDFQVGQARQRMRMLKPWLDLAKNREFLSIWYDEYLVQKTSISEGVWQGLMIVYLSTIHSFIDVS